MPSMTLGGATCKESLTVIGCPAMGMHLLLLLVTYISSASATAATSTAVAHRRSTLQDGHCSSCILYSYSLWNSSARKPFLFERVLFQAITDSRLGVT
jgi:hypothetical protein